MNTSNRFSKKLRVVFVVVRWLARASAAWDQLISSAPVSPRPLITASVRVDTRQVGGCRLFSFNPLCYYFYLPAWWVGGGLTDRIGTADDYMPFSKSPSFFIIQPSVSWLKHWKDPTRHKRRRRRRLLPGETFSSSSFELFSNEKKKRRLKGPPN